MEISVDNLPATQQRLAEYVDAQSVDPVCSRVAAYCQHGWPDHKGSVEPVLRVFWRDRGSFSLCKGLLLYGGRIVVPDSLRKMTLKKIHKGHQGIQRCRLRARCSVWWPGMMAQIKDLVERCPVCVRNFMPRHEPLMSTPLPEYPWERVASDLFYHNYLVVVDYFSKFPEVIKLCSTTSASVISAFKTIFSRFGIPKKLVTDNGSQYSSDDFQNFAKDYNFTHVTSSPYFPQSNGCAERAVQTVKSILKTATDAYMSLLIYRTTPLPWCGLSPAELLMGRRLRSNLPQTVEQLMPSWDFLSDFRKQDEVFKHRQKNDFDRRHNVKPLPLIPDDAEVWITTDRGQPVRGRVSGMSETPRSYCVDTDGGGRVRRNRQHLNVIPENREEPSTSATPTQVPTPLSPRQIMTRTRSGTTLCAPDYLRY